MAEDDEDWTRDTKRFLGRKGGKPIVNRRGQFGKDTREGVGSPTGMVEGGWTRW